MKESELWDEASRKLGKAVYEAMASILKDVARGNMRAIDPSEADAFIANLDGVHLSLEFAPKAAKDRRFEAEADTVSYCVLDEARSEAVVSGEYAIGCRLRY